MFLLPSLVMSTFLTIGLTIVGVVLALIVIFYIMYHTFHGDLPAIMKLVIAIFLLIAAGFVVIHFLT